MSPQIQVFLLLTFYMFIFLNAFFYIYLVQDLKDDA